VVASKSDTGAVFWIEVKYRREGQLFDTDRERLKTYPFPEAYWLLVSRERLLVARAEDLQKGVNFSLLRGRSEFQLDDSLVDEFTKWVNLFYEGVSRSAEPTPNAIL
jgi:hypothetical protein